MATAVQDATTDKPRKPQIFKYTRPEDAKAGKSIVNLGTSGLIRGAVQVVKNGSGDNNLHIHTGMDGMWMVLKGEVTFYGDDDEILGVFGVQRGGAAAAATRPGLGRVQDAEVEAVRRASPSFLPLLCSPAQRENKTNETKKTKLTNKTNCLSEKPPTRAC